MEQRQNHINLGDIPKKRDNEGRLICLNCSKLLKGRQQKYCGFECSNEWMCKHDQGWMRSKLSKEKKYICDKCGEYCWNYYILDHITPIALGGEEFDKKNLQILCKECNRIKTKQDMADITKQRRKEKLISKGQKTVGDFEKNKPSKKITLRTQLSPTS